MGGYWLFIRVKSSSGDVDVNGEDDGDVDADAEDGGEDDGDGEDCEIVMRNVVRIGWEWMMLLRIETIPGNTNSIPTHINLLQPVQKESFEKRCSIY